MMIFNIGDIVVPTEDGIRKYAFLLTNGHYKVLQVAPTGELRVQNVDTGTKITGIRKEAFKLDHPARAAQTATINKAGSVSEPTSFFSEASSQVTAPADTRVTTTPPLTKIVIRQYKDAIVANCGAISCSVPATQSFSEGANLALKALFAKMPPAAGLNAKICVIDGNDTLKPGHIYQISNGRIQTPTGVLPKSYYLKSFNDLESFINDYFKHTISYVVVTED